jgi:hypothetical protein
VPGQARMLTRDGYNLVQVGWTPVRPHLAPFVL